jgi:hypothetical protein
MSNNQYDVVSGFRRRSEARAYAFAYNKTIAEKASCKHCKPTTRRFCADHNRANFAIHPKVTHAPEGDYVRDVIVVVIRN